MIILIFLNAVEGKRPSYGWKSLLHGRELLRLGLKKKIGNGSSLFVWSDKWIWEDEMRTPLMKNPIIDLSLKVKDLIEPGSKRWHVDKLKDLFYQETLIGLTR